MLISSTPFGELFLHWIHDIEMSLTGLLRLCFFKQNNYISKELCLKTRQQSAGKEKRRPGARSVT
jgi:hypothetical protein